MIDDDDLYDWQTPLTKANEQASMGDYAGAKAEALKAVEAAKRDEAPGPEASAYGLLTQIELLQENGEQALLYAKEGLKIAEQLGDETAKRRFFGLKLRAEALQNPDAALAQRSLSEALDHFDNARLDEAIVACNQAIEAATRADALEIAMQAEFIKARALLGLERVDEAIESAQKTRDRAAKLNAFSIEASLQAFELDCKTAKNAAANKQAVVLMELGQPDEALRLLRAVPVDQLEQMPLDFAWNLGFQARALSELGENEAALQTAKEARQWAMKAEDQEAVSTFDKLIEKGFKGP